MILIRTAFPGDGMTLIASAVAQAVKGTPASRTRTAETARFEDRTGEDVAKRTLDPARIENSLRS